MKTARIDVWRSPQHDGLLFYRGTHVSHPYPRHWHDELQLCLYTQGHGYLSHRGSAHVVGDGDFILTSAGEVHSNWTASGETVSYRSLYVDARVLRAHAAEMCERDRVPDFSSIRLRSPAARGAFLRMHRAMEASQDDLLRQELIAEFFRLLIGECSELRPGRSGSGRELAVVKRVRRYIQDHAQETLSLEMLAAIARLSGSRLNHVFSAAIGVPPHRYQMQCRINRAKAMLRQGRDLAEIALESGFADQSHFTRCFVRVVGVTPGRFRAR